MRASNSNKHSRQPIYDWVDKVIDNECKLLSVPISSSFISDYRMGVDKSWLAGITGVNRKTAEREPDVLKALDSVIRSMIDKNILIKGETASSNNARRRLLEWYYGLTFIEKKNIRIRGNSINFKASGFKVTHAERSSETVQSAVKKINLKHNKFIIDNLTLDELVQIGFNLKANRIKVRLRDSGKAPRITDLAPYKERANEWVESVITNSSLLWEIPVVTRRENDNKDYRVSSAWIREKLNIKITTYDRCFDIINSVIPYMIEEGIIIVGENSHALDTRRKLYVWFNSLSDEDKKEIPVRNNRISRTFLNEQIGKNLTSSKVIIDAIDDIHEQLVDIDVLESSDIFICHSDRIELADKNYKQNMKKSTEEWDRFCFR